VQKTILITRVRCGLVITAVCKFSVSLVFFGFCFFPFSGSVNAQVLLNGWSAGRDDDCWPTKVEACTKNGGIANYGAHWSFGMACRFLADDLTLERYGCNALPNPYDVSYCSNWQNISQCFYTAKPDLNLSLIAPFPADPRPKGAEGKNGKSTLELIAKVMEGSTPKAGATVTFAVDVVAKTGGHGHHDAARPKGSVPASGVTDVNGEIKIKFKATEIAGTHTITATCAECSNKTVNKNVDVLVPDLAPISPNPSQNTDGSYQYAFTAVDPGHVGTSGGRQRGEYYLTAEATINLYDLIEKFAEDGWGIVGLNDASLNWGGLYDLKNNWSKPHSEHRVGEEIDISFKRAGNVVSTAKQNSFYKKYCEDKKAEVPFSILHHYVLIPHFHVRLANANKCGRTTH
jgi:hypothetical protein